jgi:hypothetical protein
VVAIEPAWREAAVVLPKIFLPSLPASERIDDHNTIVVLTVVEVIGEEFLAAGGIGGG